MDKTTRARAGNGGDGPDEGQKGGDGGNIVLTSGRGGYPGGQAGSIIFKGGGLAGAPDKELFRVLPDGDVVLAPDVTVSEAAKEFWECVHMLRSDEWRDAGRRQHAALPPEPGATTTIAVDEPVDSIHGSTRLGPPA